MHDLEQVSGPALGCFLVDEDIKCGVTFDSRNSLINIDPPFSVLYPLPCLLITDRRMSIVDVLPPWEVVVLDCGGSACHNISTRGSRHIVPDHASCEQALLTNHIARLVVA